jgi:hypothetical protein
VVDVVAALRGPESERVGVEVHRDVRRLLERAAEHLAETEVLAELKGGVLEQRIVDGGRRLAEALPDTRVVVEGPVEADDVEDLVLVGAERIGADGPPAERHPVARAKSIGLSGVVRAPHRKVLPPRSRKRDLSRSKYGIPVRSPAASACVASSNGQAAALEDRDLERTARKLAHHRDRGSAPADDAEVRLDARAVGKRADVDDHARRPVVACAGGDAGGNGAMPRSSERRREAGRASARLPAWEA